MSRAKLTLARKVAPPRVPLSLVKKALRLFGGRGVSREVRHANARKWLKAMSALGERHLLNAKAPPAKWGRPGDPIVRQVFAPRRMGAKG